MPIERYKLSDEAKYGHMKVEKLPDLSLDRTILLFNVIRSALANVKIGMNLKNDKRYVEWSRLLDNIDNTGSVNLNVDECQLCLDAIHITQYSLGPFELNTLTGHTLREYASAGLLLYDVIFGVYTGVLWTEEDSYP